jgi:hypothetical protein
MTTDHCWCCRYTISDWEHDEIRHGKEFESAKERLSFLWDELKTDRRMKAIAFEQKEKYPAGSAEHERWQTIFAYYCERVSQRSKQINKTKNLTK